MTGDGWLVLVEGKADVVFVEALIKHAGMRGIEVEGIGGDYTTLQLDAVQNMVSRANDGGQRVATVLDANAKPTKRRAELEALLTQEGLPIDRWFLLPNDRGPGCLETLLEELVVPEHRGVLQCFEEYESCLTGLDPRYVAPDRKAKIFAYCEAVGGKTKESERDYLDPSHWNLDAPGLTPLKGFLEELSAG